MSSHALPHRLSSLGSPHLIGRGSVSKVWRCDRDGADVALKVALNTQFATRLQKEARLLLLAGESTLPRLLDAGAVCAPGLLQELKLKTPAFGFVMSLAAGKPLSRWMADEAVLPDGLFRALVRDIGAALTVLHEIGFAHGDVKPDNIVVEQVGQTAYRATLIDLSLATPVSQVELVGGSPRYLPSLASPALAGGDARARDVWALALLLVEVLVPAARSSKDPLSHLANVPEHYSRALAPLLGVPRLRPSTEWLALALSIQPESAIRELRDKDRVRRAYLAEREVELNAITRSTHVNIQVQGEPHGWLQSHCALLKKLSSIKSELDGGERLLTDLGETRQRSWLLRLLGTSGANFPALPAMKDSALAASLLQFSSINSISNLTFAALQGTSEIQGAPQVTESPLEIALALGSESPSDAVLRAAETLVFEGNANPRIQLAAARALKRHNELPRAMALLNYKPDAVLRLERAFVLVRAQHNDSARTELIALLESPQSDEVRSGARSLLARLALLNNDPTEAERQLDGAPRSVTWHESHASVLLTLGHLRQAGESLERALAYPHDAEQRARIEALWANLAQQSGEQEKALNRFRQAAEYAARASAIVEEATYLIGVASSATELGDISVALAASTRSIELFTCLNRAKSAARAALSQAAAYACVGAETEAVSSARRAISLARQSADRPCQAYAHLILSDIIGETARDEHLARAESMLAPLRDDDQLRIGARKLLIGALRAPAIAELDRIAHQSTALSPRLEWWGARAKEALARAPQGAASLLDTLNGLATVRVSPDVLGPAMAAGEALAAHLGDGEKANRLAEATTEAAQRLFRGVPEAYRLSLSQLPWVRQLHSPRSSDLSPRQLADIETLMHSLSERGRLRPLLDRVLDALVLWTGVERGLLLLTAPGGKLSPRAARNLSKQDLTSDQLMLSRSLAERALATQECVVAVDAVGELPDMHRSVHALKLRSVLAVPLLAKGEALGVVYLDDRMRRGAFGPRELAWVRLVATLAAIAIADARAQLLLRRQISRTQRAERRLHAVVGKQSHKLEAAERELAESRQETRFSYDHIVGRGPATEALLQLLDRVSPSDVPVLILGESGTGKELVARALHQNSPRCDAPFITENCSAFAETLLESALFGHEAGAFTGASRARPGLFELADGGSLFLDELGEMSMAMQAKLLRVIENGEVRRVGSDKKLHVNVRVLAATHKDLDAAVSAGQFREDLLYRLNVVSVVVPPLRSRIEDIPELVRHFVDKYSSRTQSPKLPQATLDALCRAPWPGNIRQLQNATRRALIMADDELRPEHFLGPSAVISASTPASGLSLRQSVDQLERTLIEKALSECRGNQTRASAALGVSRYGLQKMIQRLGLKSARERTQN